MEEGYTSKSQSAADNSGKGYYLAYYLRREFGKRFVTVDQTFIENEDFNYGKKLAYLKDKDFLVKKNDPLFLGKVPFSELKTDFTIIRHDGLAGPRFIRYIFSRNCLKRNYNVLVEFEQLCKKYNKTFSLKYSEKINPNVLNALLSIKLITGKEFDSILDYKTYLDSTENSFYHDRIFTEEISNDLFNYIKNNPRDMNFRNMLYSIGFAPWYISPDFNPSENDWKTNDWNNSLPYLNYFDYAGLFWIGNTLEKEKARKFLKDFTKQDFTEAAEYLEWYYKNIFEYKF